MKSFHFSGTFFSHDHTFSSLALIPGLHCFVGFSQWPETYIFSQQMNTLSGNSQWVSGLSCKKIMGLSPLTCHSFRTMMKCQGKKKKSLPLCQTMPPLRTTGFEWQGVHFLIKHKQKLEEIQKANNETISRAWVGVAKAHRFFFSVFLSQNCLSKHGICGLIGRASRRFSEHNCLSF